MLVEGSEPIREQVSASGNSNAEIEHGSTVDRLKEGKLVWAAKGYSIGGRVPFGYKKEEDNYWYKKY